MVDKDESSESSGTIPKSSDGEETSEPVSLEDLPQHLQRELYKDQRRREMIPHLAMKSPMYDNIIMSDPQGQALSTVSTKKARWYVNKELAKWTSSSTIQLLFEPKARSASEYTTSAKSNGCVACGAEDHVMRHYVVPYAYRCLLPQKYKSHQSHDIVILCPKCHLYCERSYQDRMKDVEEEVRTDPSTAVVNTVDNGLHNIRSAALALLNWKDKIPQAKVEAYDALVREHLGLVDTGMNQDGNDIVPLSCEQLQQAIDVEYRKPNPEYIPGAVLVVQTLDDHEAIDAFIKEWRSFFLEMLQPRHLPRGWRLDAPVACNDHKVPPISHQPDHQQEQNQK
jgi:hypothetical protein